MADLKITDLVATTEAPDSSWLAIDDGTTTNKITVGNFNSEAAGTARSYALAAEGYAGQANDAKVDAVAAKNEAVLAVSSASDYADAASTSATAAAGSATEASGYVGQAQSAASNASASATAAAASAQGVSDYADLSKSWAIGQTGKRPDESVNNAKYWAEVAAGAAGGGVTSFNGRSGVVVPQSGDYSAATIGYTNTTSGLSATDTQAAIDEVVGGLGTAAAKDSTNAVTQSSTDLVESGAVYSEISSLGSALTNKQDSTLASAVTIGGTSRTTVEGALGALADSAYLENGLTSSSTTKALTAAQGLALANKHKVSSFEVTTSSWTQDTTSQSGTTLQKKTIALSHCYVDSPSVDIGAASGSVLPTSAQQTAYNLLQYVTVDSAIPCLYLYASDVPTDAFYINVEGVD